MADDETERRNARWNTWIPAITGEEAVFRAQMSRVRQQERSTRAGALEAARPVTRDGTDSAS